MRRIKINKITVATCAVVEKSPALGVEGVSTEESGATSFRTVPMDESLSAHAFP